MEAKSTADAICHVLESRGVRVVFGHPGGAILPFYDALHRHGGIRHVLTRHEQGAAHAADGYARATGEVGVCVATSGPGATNLVTGLATAMMDSVPMVAITGQVSRDALGKQAFQETDVVGMTMGVTKHGFQPLEPGDAPDAVAEAYRLARSGRPGPVLVDLPKDVQAAPWTGALPPSAGGAGGEDGGGPAAGRRDPPMPSEADFDRAAALLNGARRPLVMVGRGVVLSGTCRQVRALVERADWPVVTTLLGLDAFPRSDPRAVGLPGMHGTERANHAIQEADVILGLGLRFDDRVTGHVDLFAPDARIVHMDVDPGAAGRTVETAEALIGDLRDTLPALARRIRAADHDAWWRRLRGWAREAAPEHPEPGGFGALDARTAARALAAHILEAGAQVATDVGQHQMWMAQELRDAVPGSHLTSGGLGTMGYALPAALGAACGRPDRSTWVVCGDGGFQMTLQELATAVQERIPLRIAVVNNGYLGMVRQWQELFYERRYSGTPLSGPDYVALARAFGVEARGVERQENLGGALEWAEATAGPCLVELRVPPEENVYPMVPTGAALDEAIPEPVPERTAVS